MFFSLHYGMCAPKATAAYICTNLICVRKQLCTAFL